MGLLPKDFYDMELEDFLLAMQGFHDHQVFSLQMIRRQTWLMIAPHVKKPPKETDLWPLPGDKELKQQANEAISERAKQVLIEHKRRQRVNKLTNGKS